MTIRRFDMHWVDEDGYSGYLEEDTKEHGDYMSAYDVLPLEERVVELEKELSEVCNQNAEIQAEYSRLQKRVERLMEMMKMGKSCENCHHYGKDSDEEPCAGWGYVYQLDSRLFNPDGRVK